MSTGRGFLAAERAQGDFRRAVDGGMSSQHPENLKLGSFCQNGLTLVGGRDRVANLPSQLGSFCQNSR